MLSGKTDTLVISDLHIGLPSSRDKLARRIIEETECHRLILLGDIFEHFNPKRVTRKQRLFFAFLCIYREKYPQTEIVWVFGNHDKLIARYRSVPGIRITEEYTWTHRGRKYLAVHGHQFNRFLLNWAWLYEVGCVVYTFTQRLNHKYRISKLLKRIYTALLQPSIKIARGAVARYGDEDINRIICAHTHECMGAVRIGDFECYNCGSMDDSPSSCITISAKGNVHVHVFDDR